MALHEQSALETASHEPAVPACATAQASPATSDVAGLSTAGVADAAAQAAEPEFLAWAAEHERERRLHEAELAQITTHPDPNADQDAIGQQQAWARRHAHERHLHDSAIAQMRPQS